MSDGFLRKIVCASFVLVAIIAAIECNDDAVFCMDPACILKPGDYCVDNKTCEVLYCSTMWYSWAKISRFKCRGISEYYYENFYMECRRKDCAT